jgi:hypothetical protein
VETCSSQETDENTGPGTGFQPGTGTDREMMTEAEARLLTDLRRINEATMRLEHTLAEAHQAMLRAYALGDVDPNPEDPADAADPPYAVG